MRPSVTQATSSGWHFGCSGSVSVPGAVATGTLSRLRLQAQILAPPSTYTVCPVM